MKVGDKVIVRDDCDVLIDERIYVRHGIVSSIISGEPAPWYIIKFADGIVENYRKTSKSKWEKCHC